MKPVECYDDSYWYISYISEALKWSIKEPKLRDNCLWCN